MMFIFVDEELGYVKSRVWRCGKLNRIPFMFRVWQILYLAEIRCVVGNPTTFLYYMRQINGDVIRRVCSVRISYLEVDCYCPVREIRHVMLVVP